MFNGSDIKDLPFQIILINNFACTLHCLECLAVSFDYSPGTNQYHIKYQIILNTQLPIMTKH